MDTMALFLRMGRLAVVRLIQCSEILTQIMIIVRINLTVTIIWGLYH